jgi:membrane carboxypeptidase/penicillin-binding protein
MPTPVEIIQLRRSRRSKDHLSLIGKWTIWVMTFMVISLLVVVFFTGLLYVQLVKDLPAVGNIEILFTENESGFLAPIQVYDRTHTKLFDLLHPIAMDRKWLHIGGAEADVLPQALQDAIVVSHDKTFWTNQGYDLGSLISAMFNSDNRNMKSELPRSITQRLVQMTILPSADFLKPDLWRYFREAILAQRLTERYPKNQILEWYINSVGFGNLAYGADAAGMVYFGKHVPELTIAECALLASLSMEPADNLFDMQERALEGEASILQAMLVEGLITESQSQYASLNHPVLSEQANHPNIDFQRYTLSRLVDALGATITDRSGLLVFTSIDPELQVQVQCAAEMLKTGLNGQDLESMNVIAGGERCSAPDLIPPLRPGDESRMYDIDELASVILDAKNGEVLSLYGPVNKPMPSTSMLYPFIYLGAFSKGNSPGTMVLDLPLDDVDLGQFEGAISHGPVLMRKALVGGYPFALQRTIQSIGLENVFQVIEQMGVSKIPSSLEQSLDVDFPELYEISLMDTAYSYGILANSGKMIGTPTMQDPENVWRFLDPILIREIRDQVGRMLYKADPGERLIVSQELAFLISDVLKDPAARLMLYGRSNILELDRPSAVMSGVHGGGDLSWTIGYTPSRVVGVWLEDQYEDEAETSDAFLVSSALWQSITRLVTKTQPPEDWQLPTGILQSEICEPSGLLPTIYCPSVVKEYFLEGTQPVRYDTFYQPFRLNSETGKLATLFTPQDLVVEKVFIVPPPEAMEWARDAGYLQPPEEYDTFILPSKDNSIVKIEIPHNFDYIQGKKWISGRTKVDGFEYFRLQFGEGLNPTHWFQIGDNQYTPIVEGTLALWDTSDLDGLYALQLIVVDQDGIAHVDTSYVTIDNESPEVDLICPDAAKPFHREGGQRFSCDVRVSDNIDISEVEFYLNNVRIAIDLTEPFTLQLEADVLQEGTLFARAYDLARNVSQSGDVQILIAD